MRKFLTAFVFLWLVLPLVMMGQAITTAAFSGTVVDPDDRAMVGVTILAIHVPTGTQFVGTTRGNGNFNIPNVKVGGPYTIIVALEGFNRQELKDIYLKLGEDRYVSFKMTLAVVTESIVVSAPNPIISKSRTGATANVGTSIIESMPSIGRSFDDFARIAPQIDARGGGAFSAIGRNNRYNSILIDGAVNNDLFGLGSAGTPGRAHV